MEDTRMKWTEQSPAFWGSIEAILNNWLAHDTINIVCVWHDSIKVCDLTHKTCSYLSPHGSSLPSLKNKAKPKKKKKSSFLERKYSPQSIQKTKNKELKLKWEKTVNLMGKKLRSKN